MVRKIIRITIDYQTDTLKVVAETPKYLKLLHCGPICDTIPIEILKECNYARFYITEIH